ncbi:MAG: hypothetical protein KDA65_11180 [Planctomycetaceae bacterium]|nr:hypothetical protein [Planctomycetaceae bacterium]
MWKYMLLVLIFWLMKPGSVTAELKIDADFEGGSVEVVSISDPDKTVIVKPALKKGRGFPCWWYFRIEGLETGQTYSVTVQSASEAYRESEILSSRWALPLQAALSFDDKEWFQTSVGEPGENSKTYQFEAKKERAWLAWGPPFLPATAEKLLEQAKEVLPDAELFELAETRQQRSVKGIRFGALESSNSKPFGIWVQARQHAWEAGGSWVGQGFLLWAVSDDPAAVALRSKAVVHFIPIMDVDSVVEGAGGKNAFPRDHNRDWDDNPVYPEVRAAQERIRYLDRQERFDLYIDLHNPGSSEQDVYFFGPDLQKVSPLQLRNYQRLQECAFGRIGKLREEYRFPSYVKDNEEYNRMSGTWVKNHTAEHVVAVTLETGWNRPEGTRQGYQQVGRELGLSISDYFSENPRRSLADSE